MENFSHNLYLEINKSNLIFFVGSGDESGYYKNTFKISVPLIGFENERISNFDKFYELIKKNIFLIEQKFNYTFREIVLILETLDPTFINLSGHKKLNGSQILRENIIYILNILKSHVEKVEEKKKILHIFNSNFLLDSKKIDNPPIGLFGDFYVHDLSFILINSNELKNIKNTFHNCNIKIKKILLKSFIEGANINDSDKNLETFFKIKINENNSKIFFFENNSLKFEQKFEFGSNMIIKDISKITALKSETINSILKNSV